MDIELINAIFWFGFGMGFSIAFGIAVIVIQIIIIKQKENEEKTIISFISSVLDSVECVMDEQTSKSKLGSTKKGR